MTSGSEWCVINWCVDFNTIFEKRLKQDFYFQSATWYFVACAIKNIPWNSLDFSCQDISEELLQVLKGHVERNYECFPSWMTTEVINKKDVVQKIILSVVLSKSWFIHRHSQHLSRLILMSQEAGFYYLMYSDLQTEGYFFFFFFSPTLLAGLLHGLSWNIVWLGTI